MALKRLVVVASGRGSNFAAIADACRNGTLPATVSALVCNRPGAGALALAAERNIPAVVVDAKTHADRDLHEASLVAAIASYKPDFVCLAGYMKLIGRAMLERWPEKIVNIHPSLLPTFPGLRAQRQAIEAKAKVAGCTVHFVTEAMDAGPIIAQSQCPVAADDDEATLSAKILVLEHGTYVMALKDLCTRSYRIENNCVLWEA